MNRVDIWDDTGDSIVEHVAGVDDFEVAEATYRAAVARCQRRALPCDRASGWCMIPGNAPAEVGDQRDGGGWSARAGAEGVSLYPRYKFHVFDALGKLGGPLA